MGSSPNRGQRRHYLYLYLYLFNQQNYLSLYSDNRPEVGVVYSGSHLKSGQCHVAYPRSAATLELLAPEPKF